MNRNQIPRTRRSRSAAFTLLEMTAAIAVLGVVLVIVAQTSLWSLRERWRNASRETALELAANLLETARARSFSNLTSEWAKAQHLPQDLADVLPEGQLSVKVEDISKPLQARKVTVEVHWKVERNLPESVQLTTLIAPRTSSKSGGTP